MPFDDTAPACGPATIAIACPASGRIIRIVNTAKARTLLHEHPELVRPVVVKDAPGDFLAFDFVGAYAAELLRVLGEAGLSSAFTSLTRSHEGVLLRSAARRARRAAAMANEGRA